MSNQDRDVSSARNAAFVVTTLVLTSLYVSVAEVVALIRLDQVRSHIAMWLLCAQLKEEYSSWLIATDGKDKRYALPLESPLWTTVGRGSYVEEMGAYSARWSSGRFIVDLMPSDATINDLIPIPDVHGTRVWSKAVSIPNYMQVVFAPPGEIADERLVLLDAFTRLLENYHKKPATTETPDRKSDLRLVAIQVAQENAMTHLAAALGIDKPTDPAVAFRQYHKIEKEAFDSSTKVPVVDMTLPRRVAQWMLLCVVWIGLVLLRESCYRLSRKGGALAESWVAIGAVTRAAAVIGEMWRWLLLLCPVAVGLPMLIGYVLRWSMRDIENLEFSAAVIALVLLCLAGLLLSATAAKVISSIRVRETASREAASGAGQQCGAADRPQATGG